MDDFLKGREVITRSSSGTVSSGVASTLPPLSSDDRPSTPATPAPRHREETGEHGTRVETIMERGRVTRLIVTCTCGTVTEIECRY
ncbi:MAG: hypothetical protein R3F07_19780 [Opitutaceae bacterium]